MSTKTDKKIEVILKQDVANLVYKNDLVKVNPGYSRNYLIPQGIAVAATKANKKMLEEAVKQAAHKQEKVLNDAQEIAAKLENVSLEIKAKVGESGRIFGAVTPLQVSDALAENGITLDRRKIKFTTDIKTIGTYKFIADLHREIKAEVEFNVIPD